MHQPQTCGGFQSSETKMKRSVTRNAFLLPHRDRYRKLFDASTSLRLPILGFPRYLPRATSEISSTLSNPESRSRDTFESPGVIVHDPGYACLDGLSASAT